MSFLTSLFISLTKNSGSGNVDSELRSFASLTNLGSSLSEDIEKHLGSIGLSSTPSAASADQLHDLSEASTTPSKRTLRRSSSECKQSQSHSYSRLSESPVFNLIPRKRSSFSMGKKKSSLRRAFGEGSGNSSSSGNRKSIASLLWRSESGEGSEN